MSRLCWASILGWRLLCWEWWALWSYCSVSSSSPIWVGHILIRYVAHLMKLNGSSIINVGWSLLIIANISEISLLVHEIKTLRISGKRRAKSWSRPSLILIIESPSCAGSLILAVATLCDLSRTCWNHSNPNPNYFSWSFHNRTKVGRRIETASWGFGLIWLSSMLAMCWPCLYMRVQWTLQRGSAHFSPSCTNLPSAITCQTLRSTWQRHVVWSIHSLDGRYATHVCLTGRRYGHKWQIAQTSLWHVRVTWKVLDGWSYKIRTSRKVRPITAHGSKRAYFLLRPKDRMRCQNTLHTIDRSKTLVSRPEPCQSLVLQQWPGLRMRKRYCAPHLDRCLALCFVSRMLRLRCSDQFWAL